LAKGRYADALEVAGVLDTSAPMAYAQYLRDGLEVRARAAHTLGRRALEAELRERLKMLSQARAPAEVERSARYRSGQ